MRYVLVNPSTGTVELLDKESFIVPVEEKDVQVGKWRYTEDDFLNAADDTRFSVIPVIETLEWDDMADPDAAREAGLSNFNGQRWTWEQVAFAYRGMWMQAEGEEF